MIQKSDQVEELQKLLEHEQRQLSKLLDQLAGILQLEGFSDANELLEQLRQFTLNAQEDRLQLTQMASAKSALEDEVEALKAKFGG